MVSHGGSPLGEGRHSRSRAAERRTRWCSTSLKAGPGAGVLERTTSELPWEVLRRCARCWTFRGRESRTHFQQKLRRIGAMLTRMSK